MKKIIFLMTLISLSACNQTKEDKKEIKKEVKNIEASPISKTYPADILKVFNAHGGLDVWNNMKSLSFTMPKPDGNEITTVALKSRRSLIEMPNHVLGYDGKEVWLLKKDTVSYKGNPKFYYNLMFYFYGMPFVLADDGINYESAQPLQFEGKQYTGIKVSYNSEVGESPDDEYILYYDPETYQMAWLAYTVTYFSKEKSKEFYFIKYNDWQKVNGLLLPKTLQWYNAKDWKITEKNDDEVTFAEVTVSDVNPDTMLFSKPEQAESIE